MHPSLDRISPRLGAYAAALVVLFAVFALYLRPDFMVELAQSAWSCF